MLTLAELCAWLNVKPQHVRNMCSERRIPFHKVGRSVRFDPSEVRAWTQAVGKAGLPAVKIDSFA